MHVLCVRKLMGEWMMMGVFGVYPQFNLAINKRCCTRLKRQRLRFVGGDYGSRTCTTFCVGQRLVCQFKLANVACFGAETRCQPRVSSSRLLTYTDIHVQEFHSQESRTLKCRK